MQFPEKPLVLKDLLPVEERMISLRISFMKIRQLGRDKQYGLHGNCVNVPIDVDTSVSILPRTVDKIQTIHLQLMRRMTDKSPYASEIIRPYKVFEAAQFWINQPLYK